jgi:hypothetical protein
VTAVGDVIRSNNLADRLPEGTIVGFAHPVYQGPLAAVRRRRSDGVLKWEMTGQAHLLTTRQIKEITGYAPFVVLYLKENGSLNPQGGTS